MATYVERYSTLHGLPRKERLQIKSFSDRNAMFKFLATGDNSLRWRESTKGLKAGVYAFAGGKWHNVKHLDPGVLAHV